MIPFENANTEAYRLLLRIEVAVREVLRIFLQDVHGQRWQRQLLKSMREKIHEAQKDEEKRRQFGFLRLGPLYYLTLGELLPLLRQQTAEGAMNRLGGTQFLDQLENVLAPRNAVAHSRDVSGAGLMAIRALYQQLENAMGIESLTAILACPDVGVSPTVAIPELFDWFVRARQAVHSLALDCPTCPFYEHVASQFWWNMSEVCDIDYSTIENAAQRISEYNSQPKGVGSAGLRQRFVEDIAMAHLLESAVASLKNANK